MINKEEKEKKKNEKVGRGEGRKKTSGGLIKKRKRRGDVSGT